jgi:DNA-binding NarL/FixJ family response regulator
VERERTGAPDPFPSPRSWPFANRTIRVLVAEVHKRGTERACGVVQDDPRLNLVGCVSNAAEAVAAAVELMPSVCVIDADLPFGGLTAALEIGARLPTAGLVLRRGARDDDLFEALHAGVTAYLPRTAPLARFRCRLQLAQPAQHAGEDSPPDTGLWPY